MTFIDLIIVALLVSAIVNGLMQGAVMQLLGFGGFAIGFILGSAIAPAVAGLFDSGAARILIGIAGPLIGGSVVAGGGRIFGARLSSRLRRAKLGAADAAGGAAVSVGVTLLVIWLFAAMLSGLPVPGISRPVQESAAVRAMAKVMPPAPQLFARVQGLLDSAGFPQVFAELEPPGGSEIPPGISPEIRAAAQAARRSTVRITGAGCGGIQTGSGFVAADGLVVTNAHVIAGIDRPMVEDRNGRRAATPILFDSDFDLAILRVSRLSGRPLPLARGRVERGQEGAALGYPGGGSFRISPGVVTGQFEAVGRDIYSRDLTRRRVVRLATNVRPGNSGGPFVRGGGEVAGVIFSASAARPGVGYALNSADVAARVDQVRNSTRRVSTESCVN